MSNLADGLQDQINRVRMIQKQYEELARENPTIAPIMLAVNIPMMEQSIQAGIEALKTGDVIKCIAAYKDLEGYSE